MTLTEMYEALPKPDCDMKPGDEICHVANDMIELAMKGDDNQDGILNIDVEAILMLLKRRLTWEIAKKNTFRGGKC